MVKNILNRFLICVGHYSYIKQVVKTCFGIMNSFDQSINVILLKLML